MNYAGPKILLKSLSLQNFPPGGGRGWVGDGGVNSLGSVAPGGVWLGGQN